MKTAFMLGAGFLCVSHLMANTPPGRIAETADEFAPALVSSAQAVAVPGKARAKAEWERLLKERRPAGKAPLTVESTTATQLGGGSRGDVNIDIVILTDDYGNETTWELVERNSATLVASGGPYDDNTLYEITVAVDSTLCYDWTIFDTYGDGICCQAGQGYFEVYYDAELVCSGGDFVNEDYCEGMGNNCLDPTGACCVDLVCVATNTAAECDGLGGLWYEDESCPEFVCRGTYADFLVTAPYTGENYNTCGAGNDCLIRSSTDHTYEVIIPHDGIWTFSLCRVATWDTYMYLGTSLCGNEIAYNNDHESCGVQSAITEGLYAGRYFVDVEGYLSISCGLYALDIWEEIAPTGACCDAGLDCIGTMTELECGTAAPDGRWYEGEDCGTPGQPLFDCPAPGEGDTCEDPVVISAPYPVTVDGTNIGMTEDCPDLLGWNAQWFYVECPYAENEVTITLCSTTDLGTAGNLIMDDCNCDDYVDDSAYVWADPCITLHFDVAGPSYWYFPAYALDSSDNPVDYAVTFDVTEHVPCVDCEDNEGEGDCYDGYWDTYNGGCPTAPEYPLQPIACGDVMCGTSGVYIYGGELYRDMDWYELTLDSPAVVTWSAEAEFPVGLWILEGECPNVNVVEYTNGPECTPVSVSATLEAGTWILIISTADWGDYPCGSYYEATVTCGVATGACCYNNGADCVNTEDLECYNVYGGEWYIGEDCATFDCPVPCPESQIDIAIRTDYFGAETTWEITDHNTGALICSGGPYDDTTLYDERCCIGYQDCVDFTMYDSAGNGMYSPGGFTILLDGDVIFDVMGYGWHGSEVLVENFGGGCTHPTGACCTDALECVGTVTENECAVGWPGAHWFEGADCDAGFQCLETCADYLVEAPYLSPIRNTCGAGDECDPPSQAGTSDEHTYEVVIPYEGLWNFNTCTDSAYDTWIAVGTDCCLQDIDYNDDGCDVQSEVIVYLTPGNYFVDIEGYGWRCGAYRLEVREEIPCVVECPPSGIPESEPCGDDTNGGCDMAVPQFEPIACNATVCGTAYFDGLRDTDWFEYVAANDDTMTFEVEAEFEVLFGLMEQYVPGEPGCGNITGDINPSQALPDCTPGSVQFPVNAGGTYYLFVAPQYAGAFTCDSPTIHYIATLTGEVEPPCPGDLDGDNDVDLADLAQLLANYGMTSGAVYEDGDLDGDGDVDLSDLAALLAVYGTTCP